MHSKKGHFIQYWSTWSRGAVKHHYHHEIHGLRSVRGHWCIPHLIFYICHVAVSADSEFSSVGYDCVLLGSLTTPLSSHLFLIHTFPHSFFQVAPHGAGCNWRKFYSRKILFGIHRPKRPKAQILPSDRMYVQCWKPRALHM